MYFWSLTLFLLLTLKLPGTSPAYPAMQDRSWSIGFHAPSFPQTCFPNPLPQQTQPRAAVWAFPDISPSPPHHLPPAACPPKFAAPSHCYSQAPSTGAEPRARTLLSSTSRGHGEGKNNIKAPPQNLFFSTLGGSSPSTHSQAAVTFFFCSFSPFFLWHCQKKPHATAGRAGEIMRKKWFSWEFLDEPGHFQTWQCHP